MKTFAMENRELGINLEKGRDGSELSFKEFSVLENIHATL